MVSIIIRTCNEERWISHCLKAVFNQTYKDIEVIIVDNQSTDQTVERAKKFPVKVLTTGDYLPGKALNHGVRASKGDYFACLSSHCIPASDTWLETMLNNLDDSKVAGVYGRQIPMKSTSDADKRDLMISFGLDKKIQVKDPFFHNANSLIPRKVWEAHPFDETVTNIEDRLWGKTVLEAGYKIIYEPDAPVYHEHGIHQDGNPVRCKNVVCIMEAMHSDPNDETLGPLSPEKLNIVAFVPWKGPLLRLEDGTPLLDLTFESVRDSQYISQCVVLTDNEEVKAYAEKSNFQALSRPASLSGEKATIEEVFQFGLKEIEKSDTWPDLVATLEPTYPFRPPGLLNAMIKNLIAKGFDSILAGFPEYRACWVEGKEDFERIDKEGFIPRKFKHPVQVGLIGLGCVTYPNIIREGRRLGEKIGIYEIFDKLAPIEIRDPDYLPLATHLFEFYRKVRS